MGLMTPDEMRVYVVDRFESKLKRILSEINEKIACALETHQGKLILRSEWVQTTHPILLIRLRDILCQAGWDATLETSSKDGDQHRVDLKVNLRSFYPLSQSD